MKTNLISDWEIMHLKKNDFLGAKDLRDLVRGYTRRTHEIESYLKLHPYEWGRFQNEFNMEINLIFNDIMNFEKMCLSNNEKEKILKLKRIFMKRIKRPFERGEYIKWVIRKPYGYAGDFKYIEDIYDNSPTTIGYDRLFDNYTMMSAIAIAVRNRKNDFKRMLKEYILENQGVPLRIMNLGSGPCREILELLKEDGELCKNVSFDCYDNDIHSIEFSQNRLSRYGNVKFFRENATKIALKKDIHKLINKEYNLIYSTGLFDYFEDKVTLRLFINLKKLLSPKGSLLISDVRDRFSNPSLYFMEWVGEWDLIYRNDDDFRKLFIEAGFKKKNLFPLYEQQGILQYIKAKTE